MGLGTRFFGGIDKKRFDSMEPNHFLRIGSPYRCPYSKDSALYLNPFRFIWLSESNESHHVSREKGKHVGGGAVRWSVEQKSTNMAETTRKKRSKVWLHCTKKDEETASCNHCAASLSCKGGNTSSMLKHLEGVHDLKVREPCRVFNAWRKTSSGASAGASGYIPSG